MTVAQFEQIFRHDFDAPVCDWHQTMMPVFITTADPRRLARDYPEMTPAHCTCVGQVGEGLPKNLLSGMHNQRDVHTIAPARTLPHDPQLSEGSGRIPGSPSGTALLGI
jgi:hypothetical protein